VNAGLAPDFNVDKNTPYRATIQASISSFLYVEDLVGKARKSGTRKRAAGSKMKLLIWLGLDVRPCRFRPTMRSGQVRFQETIAIPFDRMLIAEAQAENLKLISND
jgi:hypothetical protein